MTQPAKPNAEKTARKSRKKPQAPTYREAYQRLRQIADELEGSQLELDRALPLLQEAQEAYATCQSHLEQLDKLLQAAAENATTAPQWNAADEFD